MKKLKLTFITLLMAVVGNITVMSQVRYIYPQNEINSEVKAIISKLAKEERIEYITLNDADYFYDLQFVGYERTKLSQWDFVRVDFPSLYAIDTTNYDRLHKMEIDRIERLKSETKKEKRARIKEEKRVAKKNKRIIKHTTLVYSNLKFFYDSEKYFIHPDNKVNGIIDYGKHLYTRLKITDPVVRKFKNSSNDFFYIIEVANQDDPNKSFIGVVSELEFLKNKSEKINVYKSKQQIILKKNATLVKQKSSTWMDGRFSELFPNDVVYIYKLSYLKKEEQDSILLNTIAYSNIHPKLISRSDFPVIPYDNYGEVDYSLNEFAFFKEINVFEASIKESVFVDSVFERRKLSINPPEYWRESVSEHPIFDYEKNEMLVSVTNGLKFNEHYFNQKISNSTSIVLKTKPYFMESNFVKEEINPLKRGRAIYAEEIKNRPVVKIILNDCEISIKSSDNVITFSYFDKIQKITRKFDTRLDKLNFNFVSIDYSHFINPKGLDYLPDFQLTEDLYKSSISRYLVKRVKDYTEWHSQELEYEKQQIALDKTKKKQKDLYDKKYGKRFVEAASTGDIIVGMHEDLLSIVVSKFWRISNRSNWKGGYRIYCYSIFDSSAKLWVTVNNKKVTNVSTN
ncbi:MAG: hypothetical protein ABF242_09705 [Flavobacteriales bacterium]